MHGWSAAPCATRCSADPVDVDVGLVVAGDAERAARALADAVGAHRVPAVGALRRVARDRARPRLAGRRHAARGGTIEEDLALRDFTVNAMAVPAGRRRDG